MMSCCLGWRGCKAVMPLSLSLCPITAVCPQPPRSPPHSSRTCRQSQLLQQAYATSAAASLSRMHSHSTLSSARSSSQQRHRVAAGVSAGSATPLRHIRSCSAMAAATGAAAPAGDGTDTKPLFSFGVITDVQHADIPDGTSFHGVPRFYRNSLVALERAVQEGWRPQGVAFGLHLGDTIDGFQPKEHSVAVLQRVLAAFDGLGRPTYHMLANHDLVNLRRAELNTLLRIPPAPGGASFHAFQPHPAWRFVVLDAYDVSLLGWSEDHPRHKEAEALLHQHNPNKDNFNSPEGLVGLQRRWVKFGGGISDEQLQWLEDQLQEADAAGQCAVVCGHLPLFPGTCPPACLLWNFEEVLSTLQRYARAGVVVATMAGHTHQNGYLVDEAGIHHLVLPAVVETPPGRDAYGIMHVHTDRLELRGVDTCMTAVCKLTPAAVERQRAAAAAAAAGQLEQQQQPGGASSTSSSGRDPVSDALVDVADGGEDGVAAKAADAAAAALASVSLSAA